MSDDNFHKLILMYLGIIPFLLWIMPLMFGSQELLIFGNIYNLIKVYGLAVLFFIFGIYWEQNKIDLIINNLIVIILWLSYLSLNQNYFYILIFGFFIVIGIELLYTNFYSNFYSKHRIFLSIITIINLLITKKLT